MMTALTAITATTTTTDTTTAAAIIAPLGVVGPVGEGQSCQVVAATYCTAGGCGRNLLRISHFCGDS